MMETFFKNMETSEISKTEINDYHKIRPEKEMKSEDAIAYWDECYENFGNGHKELKNPHEEIVDGKINYFDDNGALYRIEKSLIPNNNYEINGYKYYTDEKARITFVEGVLHMKEREGRLPIKDSIEDIGKGDQRDKDDRGHIIGDRFDGSNGLENMIPQDAEINRNDFKNFENELAERVKAGDIVKVKIELLYDRGSWRPTDIFFIYSINGVEDMRIFPNGEEK